MVEAHSIEELKAMLGDVPAGILKITDAYERASRLAEAEADLDPDLQGVAKAQRQAIREQIHSAQHRMLADHETARLKVKCVEYLEKMHALERAVPKLEKAGKANEVEKAYLYIDKAKAFTSVYCVPEPLMLP